MNEHNRTLVAAAKKSGEIISDYLSAHYTSNRKDETTRNTIVTREKRFQRLIDQAPEAFFSHDLQGRLLHVNEQTCQLTGYSRRELLSLNAGDLQKGVDPDQAKFLWEKVLAGETILAEDILQRKDGTTFPAEVKIGLFETEDDVEIFGFFRDISDRKQRESEKEALIARLQKALDEVKQLTGMLPICANCRKIRDDEDHWSNLETYLKNHADIAFSHSICPDCASALYPEIDLDNTK